MTEERPTNRSGIPQRVYWEREQREKAAQQQNRTVKKLFPEWLQFALWGAFFGSVLMYFHGLDRIREGKIETCYRMRAEFQLGRVVDCRNYGR